MIPKDGEWVVEFKYTERFISSECPFRGGRLCLHHDHEHFVRGEDTDTYGFCEKELCPIILKKGSD